MKRKSVVLHGVLAVSLVLGLVLSVEAALSKLETDMISVGVAARQELGRKRDLLRALFMQAASPAGAP